MFTCYFFFPQDRFLTVKPETPNPEDESFQWWVPITFTSVDKGFKDTYNKGLWLRPNEGAKEVTGMPGSNDAVIFNVQQTGEQKTLKIFIFVDNHEL